MRNPRLPRAPSPKRAWAGRIVSVQPRIRLTRSFDERSHSYLGYVLRLDGEIDGESREFTLAVSEKQHQRHGYRVGDVLSGAGRPVADERTEVAEIYRASALEHTPGDHGPEDGDPPWRGLAPALREYRRRGHRRLAARTYSTRCTTCMWGCEMPTEILLDHWDHDRRRYRRETHCYGPLSCPLYSAGPTRKVPGRKKGMTFEEEDWVDEDATGHRGPDE